MVGSNIVGEEMIFLSRCSVVEEYVVYCIHASSNGVACMYVFMHAQLVSVYE